MCSLISDKRFYKENDVIYPPFKNGLYMEEYFLNYMQNNQINIDKKGRKYIPVLWTNFQIDPHFTQYKNDMQTVLDKYIINNPSPTGYFTVVQHDDGPMLSLPANTVIYGACTGQVPLPLIYQDVNNTLDQICITKHKSFHEKKFLCSFVGTLTHNIRQKCYDEYKRNTKFVFNIRNAWSTDVNVDLQQLFIDQTINSKFALAPRGYGRSSFRFFEIFKLGAIPVYIWDDNEWLPYKDIIDYDKICVTIHECELDILDEILLNINEKKYNNMLAEYSKIKHLFELEEMCRYIVLHDV
jgi:hypothetical protein